MTTRGTALVACAMLSGMTLACRAPRAAPLGGITPVNARLPAFDIPPGHRLLRFKWEVNDREMAARGDGVARIAPPDSGRVDMFFSGLFGGGGASAIAIGDSLIFPPGALMTDLVPPAPLLWAVLGRLALPALPDTIIRVSGDTIRAALGRPEQWRVTAVGNRLVRVERVDGGRIVESVDRSAQRVRYELAGRRSLVLELQQDNPVAPFNASIWQYAPRN